MLQSADIPFYFHDTRKSRPRFYQFSTGEPFIITQSEDDSVYSNSCHSLAQNIKAVRELPSANCNNLPPPLTAPPFNPHFILLDDEYIRSQFLHIETFSAMEKEKATTSTTATRPTKDTRPRKSNNRHMWLSATEEKTVTLLAVFVALVAIPLSLIPLYWYYRYGDAWVEPGWKPPAADPTRP